MRLSPQTGKTDCHIIDFVDSTSRVSGVVSTPSLFGLDPDEVIESMFCPRSCLKAMLICITSDATPELLEERAEKSIGNDPSVVYDVDNVPDPTSVTYIDYDNPFELVKDTSGASHISRISRFSWVGCGNGIYVLECMGKGTVRIKPEVDNNGM